MIRCSMLTKTARSSGNSKLRAASRSSITARHPVSCQSRPNISGAAAETIEIVSVQARRRSHISKAGWTRQA
jgi:hypothetical protein